MQYICDTDMTAINNLFYVKKLFYIHNSFTNQNTN